MSRISKQSLPLKAASLLETERIVEIIGEIISILIEIWDAFAGWIQEE
jgi:hypothetical protein